MTAVRMASIYSHPSYSGSLEMKHYERGWSEVLVESTLFGVRDKVQMALDMLREFEHVSEND